MIKLQDFARQHGVTDRAIQKHLKKYETELEGLFERRGSNGTWLTDEACSFLLGKMKVNPVVVLEGESQAEVERLKEEIEALKQEIAADQRALRTATETMAELVKQHNEDVTLIAESKLYIEQRDNAKKEADALHLENQALKSELEAERARKLTWRERLLGQKEV